MNVRHAIFTALVCSLPFAAGAADQVQVTTAADELNIPSLLGCGVDFPSDTVCSLREAVQYFNTGAAPCGCTIGTAANAEIVIMLSPISLSIDGANENSNATGDIDVYSAGASLTIRADASVAPAEIDNNFASGDRSIDITRRGSQNTVTLQDLAFVGGHPPAPANDSCGASESQDGAILRADYVNACALALDGTTDVVLTNCAFTNGTAPNGGAIATEATSLILNGTAVSGNHATQLGGGIYAASGILSVQQASAVTANTAGNSGGGIYSASADSAVGARAIDCASAGGGQMALCVSAANISGNQATTGSGGGIDLVPTGNHTAHVIGSSTIGGATRNSAGTSGGGIATGPCGGTCTLSIASASVSHNDAKGGSGGGLYNQSFGVTATSATFTGNTATSNGGGIYDTSSVVQNVTITGTTISSNTATHGGGAYIDYAVTGSTFAIVQSQVTSNSATNGEGGGIDIDFASGSGTQHPQVTITGTDFTGNTATTSGGAIYNATVVTHTAITGGTFGGNSAQGSGGAIYDKQDGTSFTMPASDPCISVSPAPSVFTICSATIGGASGNTAVSGGGIASESSLFVGTSTISGNTSSGSGAAQGGGGIFTSNAASLYLARSTVSGNHSASNGGGVLSGGTSLIEADLISGNDTFAGGGGIYSALTSADTTKVLAVIDSTVTANTATGAAGGGIAALAGNTRINNATITGNFSTSTLSAGLSAGSSATTVSNTIVDLNTSNNTSDPDNDCTGASSKSNNVFAAGSSCAGVGDLAADATALKLRALANYGGPTSVEAIKPGSVALNAGNDSGNDACGKLNFSLPAPWFASFASNTDQRGVSVAQGAHCDIGAFESSPDNEIVVGAPGNGPILAGGNVISWPITVTDHGFTTGTGPSGASDARTLIVTFTLPAHTVFSSIDSSGWTCTTPGASPATFTCTRNATLASGSSDTNLTLHIQPDAAFTASTVWGWSAKVEDETADPIPTGAGSANSFTCSAGNCTVAGKVALSVSKTDSVTSVAAGAAPNYVIALTNAGPSAAVSTTVSDPLPTGVVSATWTCAAVGAGSSCPATGSGAINAAVTVAPGGSVTFTDVAQTDLALANGSHVLNQANVSAASVYSGTCNSTNACASPITGPGVLCSACDSDTVTAAVSELGVTKNAPATIGQGASLVFTTVLTVAGPSSSQNITLTDVGGSAATSFVSYALDSAAAAHFACTGAPATGTSGATTITCTSSGLVPVGTYVFSETSAVIDDGSAAPPIPYSAAFVHSGVPNQLALGDPSSLPDSASGSTIVDIESDAAITLSAAPTVIAGDTLTYALIVIDNGPSTVRNLSWSMSVPASTSFLSLTAPSGWSCALPSVGGGGAITCTASALAPASGAQNFPVVVVVDPAAPNGSSIAASAVLGPVATDSHQQNNGPVTTSTTVASDADLAVTLAANVSEVAPGGAIDYAIDLENRGPSDALMVVVTVQLPTDVAYQSITATGLLCDTPSATGLVTCTLASLAPGASDTAALDVTVSNKAASGEVLTATATATSGTPDSVPTNDVAVTQVTVNPNAPATGPVTFGGVTVSHDQVRERGGFFRCDSMGGNGASDLAALLGFAFVAARGGRWRRSGKSPRPS
jgi:uncharacterized repeat protein (TIGR01451 family)